MINLMKGDCLERMKEIESGSVDAIIADPPYGTTACKWDSVIDLDAMWLQLKRIIKPNGAVVLTASQPFTTTLISSNMKMFKYCWVWEKTKSTGFANAKKQPLRNTEDIVIFYGKQCTYNPQGLVKLDKPIKQPKTVGEYMGKTGFKEGYTQKVTGYPKTIYKCPNPTNKNVHPTQKPVALMVYLIKTYTNEDEMVLDFTCGSGSTGVAAVNTKRDFIGIEMDDKYFAIAEQRINEQMQQLNP